MKINWAKAGEILTLLAEGLPENMEYKVMREPTLGSGVLFSLRSKEPKYGFDSVFGAHELEKEPAERLAAVVIRDVNDFLKRYRIPGREVRSR